MTAIVYYAIAFVALVALAAIAEAVATQLGYIHPWEYK